jgi:DNA repair photolyase
MIAYKEIKSILNKHTKRDSWFLDDYSINPYEGCGFNCTYCYVHGSKYGENLAEKIVLKKDAAAILDKQLANRAKKNEFGFIAVGSATDAYMQVEEEIGLTRELLKIILKHRFPVFISTKSGELEKIIVAAKQHRAHYILIAGLTLFGNDERDSKQLYYKFLRNHFPLLLEKYEKMYGSVYYPSWQYQKELKKRADVLCEKYKIKNGIR